MGGEDDQRDSSLSYYVRMKNDLQRCFMYWWNKITPQQVLYFKLILALLDILSDFFVLVPFVTGSAELPCRFGPVGLDIPCWKDTSGCRSYESVCTIDDVFTYPRYGEFSDCYNNACLRNATYTYSSNGNEYTTNFDCNCQNGMSGGAFRKEILHITYFALAFCLVLVLKEFLKFAAVFSFFCFKGLHNPRFLKYALNSPAVLMLLWVPKIYDVAIESVEITTFGEERPYHILMDFIFEDLLGFVIPIWYIHHGNASTNKVAIVSLCITCFAAVYSVYVVASGIPWLDMCVKMGRNVGLYNQNHVELGINRQRRDEDQAVLMEEVSLLRKQLDTVMDQQEHVISRLEALEGQHVENPLHQ